MAEYNDIYDTYGNVTGRVHRRGSSWKPGEYGLVVCVWVHDGRGNLLLTQRAPQKSFAGTWENSGGAAQVGENSRQAVARELFEETGIQAEESEFEYLDSDRDAHTLYDFYSLRKDVPLDQLTLQPEETVDAKWVDFQTVHAMIQNGEICRIIARQFLKQEKQLLLRQRT